MIPSRLFNPGQSDMPADQDKQTIDLPAQSQPLLQMMNGGI
jgi:hypothetical protein